MQENTMIGIKKMRWTIKYRYGKPFKTYFWVKEQITKQAAWNGICIYVKNEPDPPQQHSHCF